MAQVGVLFIGTAPPGAAPPRLFGKADGREVFMRTVELYANRDAVQQRILCVTADDLPLIQQKYSAHLAFQGVQVAAGEGDWFALVARGLEKLKNEIDTVIVHDACRPAVPYTLLDALDEAVAATGAAVPVAGGGGIWASLTPEKNVDAWHDQSGLVEVQSPQIFQRKLLADAYAVRDKVKAKNLFDDAGLVRACGGRIATVPGTRLNQRIDGDDVLRMAGDLLKHMPRPKPRGPTSPFEEAQW